MIRLNRIEKEIPHRRCPKCGWKNAEEALVLKCEKCGEELAPEVKATKIRPQHG